MSDYDYDLRLDIPARSYINAQLLSLIEQGGTFWEAKKSLFSREPYVKAHLDPYTYKLHDHSLAISLLFCLIVVPKEILDLPANDAIYDSFNADKITSLFTIAKPYQIDAFLLIRCLRNSVAHALFSITSKTDGATQYKFWTDRDPLFIATISHPQLVQFLSIVGQRLATKVLQKKS